MSENKQEDERFYFKNDWLVTHPNGTKEFYHKTPVLDIIEKLPRNINGVYNFEVCKSHKARELPVITDEGSVTISLPRKKYNQYEIDYFERRFGDIHIADNSDITVNMSENGLADSAKSKLTAAEYDYLVNSILADIAKEK